jgi:hypothetical protein
MATWPTCHPERLGVVVDPSEGLVEAYIETAAMEEGRAKVVVVAEPAEAQYIGETLLSGSGHSCRDR